MKCSFCGKEYAQYQLKNGKWCCSPHYYLCEYASTSHKGKKFSEQHVINLKKSLKTRKYPLEEISENINEICCECGKRAIFYIGKKKKPYCSDRIQKCPVNHKKSVEKWLNKSNIKTDHLCDYGCGKVAKYVSISGKYRCSKNHASCPEIRKRNSETNKIKQNLPRSEETKRKQHEVWLGKNIQKKLRIKYEKLPWKDI
jgi:uncharacterized protein YggL (DUF469 family)